MKEGRGWGVGCMCWLLAYTSIPREFRKFIGIREKFHRRKSLRVFRPLMRRLNTDVFLMLANSKRAREHRRVFLCFSIPVSRETAPRQEQRWLERRRASKLPTEFLRLRVQRVPVLSFSVCFSQNETRAAFVSWRNVGRG